jgi:C_GCAxxG_C_C family probable redox protein
MSTHPAPLDRRRFVEALPALALLPILDHLPAAPDPSRSQTGAPPLFAPFTTEEQPVITASAMARDIAGLTGQSWSCAESVCLVGLRHLGRPEEEVRLAMSFGGGLGHGELCGLLTGAMMVLGAAAGAKGGDRNAQRRRLRIATETFWKWWTDRAPLTCRELRPRYGGPEEYLRMAQRVAAHVEGLITAMV